MKRYALNPVFEGEAPDTITVSKMTNQRDFNTDWFFEGFFLFFSSSIFWSHYLFYCFVIYLIFPCVDASFKYFSILHLSNYLFVLASSKLRFSFDVKVRKSWELAYIYSNFRELITPTSQGLVFGECNTALTPYFISQGLW